MPYRDDEVDTSSCYVMPVMLDDAEVREPLRAKLLEQRVQTSVLYPAIHEFTAYEGSDGGIAAARGAGGAHRAHAAALPDPDRERPGPRGERAAREPRRARARAVARLTRRRPCTRKTLPTVDVVVPAFNEEGHVDRCLDAIFAQDYPADRYRVWVVDAGSTDETARVVRDRAADGRPARARERAAGG